MSLHLLVHCFILFSFDFDKVPKPIRADREIESKHQVES